jgi:hypothetical protein
MKYNVNDSQIAQWMKSYRVELRQKILELSL